MSQFGTEYRLEWDTMPVKGLVAGVDTELIASQTMRVSIYDTDNVIDDTDTPEVITLVPTGTPLKISTINNAVDKFQPIRSKQAIIEFLSNLPQFQDATTFADASDNRWYVKIFADTTFQIFEGFVMISDIQQSFQPDPVVVSLTCSDHLGVLKDVPFTTDDGDNPTGKYRLAEIIAICLKKTGLNLQITAVNNLRHGSGALSAPETLFLTDSGDHQIRVADTYYSFFYKGQMLNVTGTVSNNTTFHVIDVNLSGTTTIVSIEENPSGESATAAILTDASSIKNFYDGIFLDAKTFESEISECRDCYSVLETIFGKDCFITQYLSKWWIIRVDEMSNNGYYPVTFDADGNFLSFDSSFNTQKSIGANEDTKFALADAIKRFDRPHKFVKETFKFQTPIESICNIDYSRGDVTTDIDLQRSGYTSYVLDCWEVKNNWGSNETTPNIKAAILRSFNTLGDEEQRFIMVTFDPDDTLNPQYIRSSAIPAGQNDKFTLRFDVAAMQDTPGDGVITICMVILYGNDGSVWIVTRNGGLNSWLTSDGEVDLNWRQTNNEVTLFRIGLEWAMFDDADHPNKTEWTPCVIVVPPLPIDGDLRIHLFQANERPSDNSDDFDIKYQNIQLDYRAYLGGSYQKYTGQYQKVTRAFRPTKYFASRDEEVTMSDSPRALFKGAMFWYDGTNYHLTSRFYTAAPFYTADPPASVGTPPDLTYLHAYGYIQAFSVWNQYLNANRIFEGSVLGLGNSWADLPNVITLTDNNPNTNDRYFMLISYEQDWKSGIWKGTFIEVFRTDIGKFYDDDHEFKFITS